jgi:hypothetical protein
MALVQEISMRALIAAATLFIGANHVDGTNYTIDAALAGECKAGSVCTAPVTIKIAGDCHINDSYKYKLTANAVEGVEFLGKDGNVFSGMGAGGDDFAKTGEKSGVLTLKFKPSKPGAVVVAGKMKLALCSKETCKLDSPDVAFTFTVK